MELEITIPDYITVAQYQKMSTINSLSELDKISKVIATVTGLEQKEVKTWDMKSLRTVSDAIGEVVERKGEFHSILEFKDTLYGFATISKFSLGEYIDLEQLLKEPTANLHKIAALLYRPITKHNFGKISFLVKNAIKIGNNNVENVFDHYTIEKYDSDIVAERHEEFKDFPVHIVLGALSFFFAVGNLLLNSTHSSENPEIQKSQKMIEEGTLATLSLNIGGGGGLYTHSPSLTYFQYPEIKQS